MAQESSEESAAAPTKIDKIAERIRSLVERELEMLEQMTIGLGEDGLDRLAKCALVLQRIRPAAGANGTGYSDKELMAKSGGLNE